MKRLPATSAALVFCAAVAAAEPPPYTTRDGAVVDRTTGEKVLLQGFGIGGWLLPEGYMWGIRTLDRPRQFEEAIAELVGVEDAQEFWRLYHENFLTEDDVRAMKAFGANSLRIALLASQLQPREGQGDAPPYVYSRTASPADFSASFMALWDDENLYLLIEVQDDVLVNTDPRSYHNDSVEVFLDLRNSKTASYGDGHFQLRATRGRDGVDVERGEAGPGIRAGQAETEGGYAVEIGVPWKALGGRGGPFLGLDVHVNDNDNDRREDKLAWWASSDEAHLKPSIFGTARLVGD